ncbi:hypothetical protein RUND412_000597 [Rhizina undulata]
MPFYVDIPEVASGRAGELIKRRSSTSKSEKGLVLHGTWFCPHAQRVWITLEELGLDYTFVETGPRLDPENKRKLQEINQEGRAPILMADGKSIHGSLEICEYLACTYGPRLLPKSPSELAKAKSQIMFITQTLQPSFFSYLFEQDPQNIARKHLLALSHLKTFTLSMQPIPRSHKRTTANGAYFFGDQFSLVDIFLAPLVARLLFFEEIKGFIVFDPDAGYSTRRGNEWIERWNMWRKAVMMRRSVDDTMSDREAYRRGFEWFAGNGAFKF